jgi:phosphoribosylformimino-5-aminoimidazole carboxamide ribotide isomerase
MLSGPNLELYAHLRRIAPALSLIASGGIRDIADLQAMRSSGVAAAVLGRSLLDGALSLAEALSC